MGHESIVYGVIVGSRWNIQEPTKLQVVNQAVIEALPTTDDWPFLTRAMFACAGDSVDQGRYKSQAIHFGATFKEIESDWHDWLEKFEHLLQRLFWDDVYLHLRTEGTVGHYDYLYQAIQRQTDGRQSPEPVTRWHVSGGPRRFLFNGPVSDEPTEWLFDTGVWTPKLTD